MEEAMKYVMATVVLALVACGGTNKRAPTLGGSEPVSTTRTTSAALTTTTTVTSSAEVDRGSDAPMIAATEKDRALGAKIKKHLQTTLKDVEWNRVRMEISDGHVKLGGDLPTLADSTAVEQCVREVKGVTGVTNEITLRAGQIEGQ